MKKPAITLLQIVLVLIGIFVLSALLAEPHFEGVNANARFFEVYADPFIVYVYTGSIPFFLALSQAYKLLEFVRQNKVFSLAAVKAMRHIKFCALVTATAIIGAIVFIIIMSRATHEDAAGALMLGMITTFASLLVATAAAVFENVLQNAVDLKAENDLTV